MLIKQTNNQLNKGVTMSDVANKSEWKFEKFMFGMRVSDNAVVKYTNEKGQIRIVREYDNCNESKVFEKMYFENQEEFENFIDSVVSDEDAVYNKANALWNLIDAMK